MLRSILVWLGFAGDQFQSEHKGHSNNGAHEHGHTHGGQGHTHSGGHAPGGQGHGHTHGVVDPTIATTARGIWAIKWSFVILAITAVLQLAVVFVTGSVALLADTIHNHGDAATAIQLWIAFVLARRKPSPRFTYGYGRVEDLAGVAIVLIILASAIVAAYAAIDRLIHPQPITLLGWVALAGIIGFVGNEAVAVFRIRVGRQINSVALIADGYHARTDGLTSLAVVIAAIGVWLGYPLADPIIGLLITLAIFGIVWQSAKAVFTRMLDGIEPSVTARILHVASHVPLIREVLDVRARWLGHRLAVELDIALDGSATLDAADAITARFERELFEHMPALSTTRIRVRPYNPVAQGTLKDARVGHGVRGAGQHHHTPAPVALRGRLAEGVVEIIDTPEGERLRFFASRSTTGVAATVTIERDNGRIERLELIALAGSPSQFVSAAAPEEPHEFDAQLHLQTVDQAEILPFRIIEPADHDSAQPTAGHRH